MPSRMRITVLIFLLTSAVASAYHSGPKLRRDGVLNLYPFPRVGRASRNTWQIPVNDYYPKYEPIEKRQLYAFPRVGRSDVSLMSEPHLEQFHPMQQRRAESPGMWFGPRLGRSFKNDDNDIQIENSDRSQPEQMESLQEERKKRQTYSNN